MRYPKDGDETVNEYTHVDTRNRQFQTYFVLIDQAGRLYCTMQSGSFISLDNPKNIPALFPDQGTRSTS